MSKYLFNKIETFLTVVFRSFFFFTVLQPKNSTTKRRKCQTVRAVSFVTNAGMSINSTLCRCHVSPCHTSHYRTQRTTTQSSGKHLVSRSESRVQSALIHFSLVQDPQGEEATPTWNHRHSPIGRSIPGVQTRGRESCLSPAQEKAEDWKTCVPWHLKALHRTAICPSLKPGGFCLTQST